MIKTIFRGKKNLFVVLNDDEKCNQRTLHEINFKTMQINERVIPDYAFDEYLATNNLKKVSYSEFEEEYEALKSKEVGALNNLEAKIKTLLGLKKSPEVRHFLHELQHNIIPLMTEGLLKVTALVGNHFNKLFELTNFESELKLATKDALPIEDYVPSFTENEYKLYDALYLNGCSQSIVKKGQFIFNEIVLDEAPLDEEVTESENLNEENLVAPVRTE